MAWIFSKRCKQSLKDKKLKVSIPLQVRTRIWLALKDYDETFYQSTETGFNYETSFLQQLPKKIMAEHSLKELLAFPESGGNTAVRSDLEGFIMRGNYPPYLFDAIELFCEAIFNDDQKNSFQQRINAIMDESVLPWRMTNGKIFPVDSSYIEEEILRKSYSLLHEVEFQGALEEFEKARVDLSNNDYEGNTLRIGSRLFNLAKASSFEICESRVLR